MILFILSDPKFKNGSDYARELMAKKISPVFADFQIEYLVDTTEKITKKMIDFEYHRKLIQTLKPSVVVTMGKQALSLFGIKASSVKSVCNIPQKVTQDGHTFWVYPTHTFTLLLSKVAKYRGMSYFERLLQRVKEMAPISQFRQMTEDEYPVKFITSISEANKALKELSEAKTISLDIETAGLGIPKEAQLDPFHIKAKVSLIGLGTEQVSYVFDTLHYPELIDLVKQFLTKDTKTILTWNGISFDRQFIEVVWDISLRHHTFIDGMIAFSLADRPLAEIGKSLKFVSSNFLPGGAKFAGYQKNDNLDKEMKEGNGEYLDQHWSSFMTYCGIDIWLTFRLTKLLWNSLNQGSRRDTLDYLPTLTETLQQITKKGIRIDLNLLSQYLNEIYQFLEKLEATETINLRSTQEIGQHMLELGLNVPRTEKGNPKTDIETLESLVSNPFCNMLLAYRKYDTFRKLAEHIFNHCKNGYMHPYYNGIGTASGRVSSEIHTIPKETTLVTLLIERPRWPQHEIIGDKLIEHPPNLKNVFITDPGYTFLYADYSQLEIVILANFIEIFSQDKTLSNAIKSGKDLHSYTASLLYSILEGKEYTYEFIKANKDHSPYKEWRSHSKSVIFGLIFGSTAYSLKEKQGITLEEAEKIISTMLSIYPGIKDYMSHQIETAQRFQQIQSLAGHVRELKILSLERWNGKARNIALNHPIQSTATMLVNCVLIELFKRLQTIGGDIILTVHDSIGVQIPNNLLEQGKELMKDTMLQFPMTHLLFSSFLKVPLTIELEQGTSWGNIQKVGKFVGKI